MFIIQDMGRYLDNATQHQVMAFDYQSKDAHQDVFWREILTVNGHESGIWPPDEFNKRFRFVAKK